ncbi:MAG: ABC transporter permease [Actinomycetes bacterium]|jgi:ABC-2 type transport system permease protein|nr:MAG: hypothetical protein DIU67_07495 [Actinomycetota bacterium]
MGSLTRIAAFVRKDLMEVLRQPRMVLILIVGPFLILLAFGLGYDATRPPLDAIVVMSPDNELNGRTDQLAESLGSGVTLSGVTEDEGEARRALADGETDLVIVAPEDPEEQVEAGEQSTITVYHAQIDPFERAFVEIAIRSAVEELNRAILRESLTEVIATNPEAFPDVDPAVMVSPFRAEPSNVSGVDVSYSHFYVPGVVALLLQHLAVTFGALALVRERTLGSVDLFRVSPLSAGETLVGKFLAYVVLAAIVGAALVAAAVYGFGFPMAGDWLWFAGMALLVIMGSLGIGMVISAVVRTESEAIQYAMLVLLFSIFFSGFFIPIERLLSPVQVVSYLLPATYGMAALQQVSFLGTAPETTLLLGAASYAAVSMLAAWALVRRQGITTHRQKVAVEPVTQS